MSRTTRNLAGAAALVAALVATSEASAGGLVVSQSALGAEATMMIRDAVKKTPARVYSTIGFDFRSSASRKGVVAGVGPVPPAKN